MTTDPEPLYRDEPPVLNERQMKGRAKYAAAIKATRARVKQGFTPGCRIEFRRGPATPTNPTIRVGTGRFLRLIESASGRYDEVEYIVDGWKGGKPMRCGITTFLKDNPVAIEED